MVYTKVKIVKIIQCYNTFLEEGISFFSISLISISKILSCNLGIDGDLVIFISKNMPLFYGIDGFKSRLCNLIIDGIVDSQKFVVSSFKNAMLISSIFLKIMNLITEYF